MRGVCLALATAAVTVTVGVVGCRGVIGVEELDLASDGGTTSGDAKADSTPTSPTDSAPPPNACAASADCAKCCHDDPALKLGFAALGRIARDSKCICGPAPCATQCGADLCVGSMGQPAMECLPCVDMQIRPPQPTPQCSTAKASCNADSVCKPFLDCITSCK